MNKEEIAAGAKVCLWQYDDTHYKYDTACGGAWAFEDGKLTDNGAKFCIYCGGRIQESLKPCKTCGGTGAVHDKESINHGEPGRSMVEHVDFQEPCPDCLPEQVSRQEEHLAGS